MKTFALFTDQQGNLMRSPFVCLLENGMPQYNYSLEEILKLAMDALEAQPKAMKPASRKVVEEMDGTGVVR